MTEANEPVRTDPPRGGNGHPLRAGEREMTARFPDFAAARKAIEELERSGLEGATMAFDEDSLQRARNSEESGARDERFLRRAASELVRGALIGAIVGLVVGAIVGFALFADGPMAGVVASLIALTAAGALVGFAMGGIWNHQQSPAWEETFEAPDAGEAYLHIRVSSDEEQRLVEGVFADNHGELVDSAH